MHTGTRLRAGMPALLLACILACLPWAHVMAADSSSQQAQHKTKVEKINVSAAQAARAARHQYGGKVLGVMLEADSKAPYYRVTLLSSGQVRVVRVTAHKHNDQ